MYSEEIVVGKDTEYPLDGLLTLPENNGEKKFPAVVLVHGSGSSDKDESLFAVSPFLDLAEGLAKLGVASIRYDKRSFIYGEQMVKSKQLITVKDEVIEDALRAVMLLRQDERIDHDRIFIVGHSMGGMLAPRIDEEGGNFKGLVILAGTPRQLEEVMKDQMNDAINHMNPVMRLLAGGSIKKMIHKFDGLYEMSDEQAMKVKVGGGTTLYYFKEMGEYDTKGYFERTSKPVFIMQGDKDFQVDVEKDFNAYKDMLKDYPNVTFRLYEGLNHCFMPSVYGMLSMAKQEYSVEAHMDEGVIGDIAQWILSQE